MISFDMLIPHYQDEAHISELLHDLITTNRKWKPEKIHIVNDGEASDDFVTVCSEYSKFLPLKVYEVERVGYINLIHNFLMDCEAENVLVSHADTKLSCNNANVKFLDPVSVLGFYISDNDNIAGISCYSLGTGKGVLNNQSDSDSFIIYGIRTVTGKSDIASLYTGFKASFPLRESFGEFQRCISFDDKFYALNVSAFKKVGGFKKEYFDYSYYLDDYFARCREKLGLHAVFTNETAVKHELRDDKPEGSTAYNNTDKVQFFSDNWSGSEYISGQCLRGEPLRKEEIRIQS
tara:strand:- start:5648 stop:6523 length:876 start_codon:yes stop_codon:yes gene_type:complete